MQYEIDRLAEIRRWEDQNLPIYGSLLGHDLVLLLAQVHRQRRSLSMKELYGSLPYSENAIRQHLKRLMREGWLRPGAAAADRRLRLLAPSDKLARVLESYAREALR